jgi:hypothetical protein
MHEMPSVAADLRSLDRETLAALVLGQQEKLLSRDSEIEHLKLLVEKLKRMLFGRSSEKVQQQIEQLGRSNGGLGGELGQVTIQRVRVPVAVLDFGMRDHAVVDELRQLSADAAW